MKTKKAVYSILWVAPIFIIALVLSACEKKSPSSGNSNPPMTAKADTFSTDTDSMVFLFKSGTNASEYKLKVLPTGTVYKDTDLPVQVTYLSDKNQFIVTTQSSAFSPATVFCLKDTAGCPDTMKLSSFRVYNHPTGESQIAKFSGVGVVDLRGGLKHSYIWDLNSCALSIFWTDATLQIGSSSGDCFSWESSEIE